MTWHDLTWLDSWQDSWHKTKNKLYTFSCSRHTVKLATFPRTRNAVCFGSQIGVCLPLWHRWCFCALGPTLMKNRASYTLEIFKIFIFSFFYHFGYHCVHHFLSFILSSSFFYHFLNQFFIIFLSCFIIFLSCFIIFSSSGAKIFQEMENYNFPRVFFIFYHFLSFLLPVVELMQNDSKNDEKWWKQWKKW